MTPPVSGDDKNTARVANRLHFQHFTRLASHCKVSGSLQESRRICGSTAPSAVELRLARAQSPQRSKGRDMSAGNTGWGLKVSGVGRAATGRKVLGPGRVELLEHIDRQRSISAAAKQMNMSYRRAWELVRDMNDAAGVPLVEAKTGGSEGGGARLTPHGRAAVRSVPFARRPTHRRRRMASLFPPNPWPRPPEPR